VQFSLTGISQLATGDPSLGEGDLGVIHDAAITVVDGVVAWIGLTNQADQSVEKIDAGGRAVIAGFVDSHSHIMFAGDRSTEFAARMAGIPYSAGGIRVTVEATRAASDEQLRANAMRLIKEMHKQGTTTIEIKSGYGLDVNTEKRSVQIASELVDDVTFMGAHVIAPEYLDASDDYVDLVCGDMLEACAAHSSWIDVFCDRGAFTTEQSERILRAGIASGLKPRIHLNQLEQGDGLDMAVALDCASADHLTFLSDADISKLSSSNTVAGLVPAADFSTRAPNYPRARDLIDAGVAIALSPDCNPGSSYTTSMPFTIALAVREMHMTVDEALLAATVGGATALRRTDVGTIRVGNRADFALLNAPSYIHLAYRPGVPLVHTTWKDGLVVHTEGDLR
jgi:imidazolonepropionase